MMSVDDEIVGAVQAAPLVQKGQAIVRVVPLKVMIEIKFAVLHDGKIYGRAGDGHPAHAVRVLFVQQGYVVENRPARVFIAGWRGLGEFR